MNQQQVLEILNQSPVIAAIKDEDGLQESLRSDAGIVFVLYGDIITLPTIIDQLHQGSKVAIVHIDLIEGLAAKDVSVDFLAQNTYADGIISTKPLLVKRAKEKGLLGIRRFFLLDSRAVETMQKTLNPDNADFVEVLPGTMPKVLCKIAPMIPLPLIAGGLIQDKEDVMQALSAGAVGISSTKTAVWYL